MASISSLMSSGSSSSIYGSRSSNIISGLASGLDTESLIQGMVQNIKSKIDKQNQQKTVLGWQQQAYRNISNQLVSLSNKYTSYTSSTNLMSNALLQSNIATALGSNAGKVSVSGSTNSNVEILGIKNLATNTSVKFDGINGQKTDNTTITSGSLSLSGTTDVSNFAGKSITFEYGSKAITVSFGADAKDMTKEQIAEEIKKQFNEQADAMGIDDEISLEVSGGSITVNNSSGDTNLKVVGGSEETLGALGLKKDQELTSGTSTITVGNLNTTKKNYELLSGATINVTYDGKSGVLTLPEMDDKTTVEDVAKSLNDQLAKLFGDGRVSVTESSGKLEFEVAGGENGKRFTINSASEGLLGDDGLLGLQAGATNGVNTNMTLGQLGIITGDGKQTFTIGSFSKEYDANTKLSTIISDINNSDAGVKVTYSSTTNQFLFTSTQNGSGGNIVINANNEDGSDNLAANIFGTVDTTSIDSGVSSGNITKGQDATMAVNVNGVYTEITSDTNTFNIDGLVIEANQTFNQDVTQATADTVDKITFSQKADADKIVNAIKTFVEDYNAMLADLREAYTTKPNKDYTALTDDQKAEMTDKQIEKWEEKAKQGILFGDSELRSLATEMRFAFSSQQLQEIGITTSTEASDGGKLCIDEEKLRAAIQSDPDSVKEAFNPSSDEDSMIGGGMQKFKEVLDKYAKTTGAPKGILIEKAGSEHASTSLIQNSIQKEMDDIDDIIEQLTDKLNDKIDFYTSKFSKLEILISQANSQSSYLAGMSGGY